MAILTTSNIGHSFGVQDLFNGISIAIPNDGKIALVGPNGVGKTTLLLILAGISKPSTGEVHCARGKKLGYLPQEAAQAFDEQDDSVFDELLTIFAHLRKEESKLRQMEAEISADASEALLERYGAALEKFELDGGYDYEIRVKQVLQGLGFVEDDWQMKLRHLSGGQKTRVLLAKLLLEKPDLLILDEPTNHLDVSAIEWLENTLRIWDGAMIIVSHDRYFLDKVANTIWEMGPNGIESYRGNYSAYVRQRRERWEQRRQAFKTEKERLEKELDYIRRNISGQRTQMAKGKLSRISRELDAIQRGGLDAISGKRWSEVTADLGGSLRRSMSVAEAADAIKALEGPGGRPPSFNLNMKASHRSGQIVLRTSGLKVGYPTKFLFTADDIELHRLQCAALIGSNGTGKTTFLRTILGDIEPLDGEIRPGASLKIGYFAQAHEGLNPENRVFDELLRHHQMLMSDARKYLARYMFQGDDAFKPVRALSGGERGRLALAILALEGANFLLLDEPSNHLDIPAQEMLQEVLEHFEGTILLVSHDRYLVDHLASEIWQLENNRLQIFKGSYQEYLVQRDLHLESAKESAAERRQESREKTKQNRAKTKADKKVAKRLTQLEHEIHELENRLENLSRDLQQASEQGTFDSIHSLSLEYGAAEKQLTAYLADWEKLAHEQSMAG